MLCQQWRRRYDPVADCRKQAVRIALRELFERRLETTLAFDLGSAQPERRQFAVQKRDGHFARSLGLLLPQPLPYSAFGTRGDYIIGPILTRRLALGGYNLDGIARLELIA